MKQLISLPAVAEVLGEYGDLAAACRRFGCDGLEVVWGGEPLPTGVPRPLHVGYHLTFWPDWLDFWNNDRAALLEKFGTEEAWTSFYGGPAGRETLLRGYRADLERAVAWGAEYVVFHVSNVSLEESYTYRWRYTSRAVLSAAAQAVNLLLDGREWPFALLVENQWWPGFTFTRPAETRWLLEAIHHPNKGIMLDTGHLMNTDLALADEAAGAAYLHRMLDEHGDLCRAIRGIHLHQSVSGAYVRAHTGALPAGWGAEGDYVRRFGASYGHVLQIDTHRPWTAPAVTAVIDRIAPEYLVHELSGGSRAEREARLAVQLETLQRGWKGM